MKKIILLISFFVITIVNAKGVIEENNQTKDKNSSGIFGNIPIDDTGFVQSQAPRNHNPIYLNIDHVPTKSELCKKYPTKRGC